MTVEIYVKVLTTMFVIEAICGSIYLSAGKVPERTLGNMALNTTILAGLGIWGLFVLFY